jgi:hypothetical protein
VRAGELIEGHGPVSPTWGWVSPTYGQKNPALSFAVIARGQLPLLLNTTWIFPDLEQRRITQDRDIQTGQ